MKRNPLIYPASAEQWWRNMLASMTDYEPKTSFFSDLSIAECFGVDAIRQTYNKVIRDWGNDIVYITEFTMCLNHKIWQLHEVDEPTAQVYDELWRKACEFVTSHFEGEDLSYYYRVTD